MEYEKPVLDWEPKVERTPSQKVTGPVSDGLDNLPTQPKVLPEVGGSRGVGSFEQRSLQHTFGRHGKDFGFEGKNWNKTMEVEFNSVLRNHMTEVTPIQGTYRVRRLYFTISIQKPA